MVYRLCWSILECDPPRSILLFKSLQRAQVVTDLLAAGAGAGVAAGFGAPMSGVIFAVETVLLSPSKSQSPTAPQKRTTLLDGDESGVLMATVLVSCVTAAVVSQAGLGLEPAFHVPDITPLSLAELPLCLAMGLLCGTAAAGLGAVSKSSELSFTQLRACGVPVAVLPILGGLACGSLAVLFPEITYQGFDNLNALLQPEDRSSGHTAITLLALVIVKVLATSVCRGSGLVGGVYAPALFIGAALGVSFWIVASDASAGVLSTPGVAEILAALGFEGETVFTLASANVYALVGAAAMLAAFCRVPLTSVLLLFELTQDYTVIVPTLLTVGFARWSAATGTRLLNSGR
jgi:H+/Cl- antiporter ClcA